MGKVALTPFPRALVVDTSFLRTVGDPGSAAYRTFMGYVETAGIELFLGPRVVEELEEQRGYVSIDWIEEARSTERVSIVDFVQMGVRVHDGPRAGEVMDRVHQRLAAFEGINPDELRKTDSELAALAVMLLGSTPTIRSVSSWTTRTPNERSWTCSATRTTRGESGSSTSGTVSSTWRLSDARR